MENPSNKNVATRPDLNFACELISVIELAMRLFTSDGPKDIEWRVQVSLEVA